MDTDMSMAEQNSSSTYMGMQMTFYWGERVELMFPGWSPHTLGKYLISMVALFALALFYQTLTYVRNWIIGALNHERNNSKGLGTRRLATSIAETMVFAVNAGTGYILMLAVTSYNVGVFMAVIAGLSAGFFFFQSWKRSGPVAEISQGSANQTAEGTSA